MQPDLGWPLDDAEADAIRASCRFVGLTALSVEEINCQGKLQHIRSTSEQCIDKLPPAQVVSGQFGEYHALNNSCQTFVQRIVARIPLLCKVEVARLGEPNKTFYTKFPKSRSRARTTSPTLMQLIWPTSPLRAVTLNDSDFAEAIQQGFQQELENDWELVDHPE